MTTKIGLALSGGGAKGIAHIGVLKVLEEAQIPVHLLAGTSMGGVIAAAYAAGRSTSQLEQFACSIHPLDVLQRDPTGLGLLGKDKIANWLRDVVGGEPTFDQLRLPLALVAVDLERSEEVIIREGSVIEGVLATIALPVVFSPQRWQGRWLVDGGVLNPVPFDVVRDMGGDRVIAVYTIQDLSGFLEAGFALQEDQGTEAFIRRILRRLGLTTMLRVNERSMSIMGQEIVRHRVRESPPDLMIKVPLQGVGLFDFDRLDVCISKGEETARQYLPDLIKIRDATRPGGRWRYWWQELRHRLTGTEGELRAVF